MAVNKIITKPGVYSITFTCYSWLPLISITGAFDLVYNWFDVMKKFGNEILAFTIMPNHIHLILFYAGGDHSLNVQVGNGKRFMAYGIVKRLKKLNKNRILKVLREAVLPSERKKGINHKVWRHSFDTKECRTKKFLFQKIKYIHKNPCHRRWKLATESHLYLHSSASFYRNGTPGSYPVTHYRKFFSTNNISPTSLPRSSIPGN